MKRNLFIQNNGKRAMALLLMAVLACTPALAQRNGGQNNSSRSGGGHATVSRSSSPTRSSSPSRSSSSTRSSVSSTRSSAPTRSSVSSTRSSAPDFNRSAASMSRGNVSSRSSMPASRGGDNGNRNGVSRNDNRPTNRATASGSRRQGAATRGNGIDGGRVNAGGRGNGNGHGNGSGGGLPAGTTMRTGNFNNGSPHQPYATPYRPNAPMPPSHRPMHPAPYFHNPYNHGLVHMRPCVWDPIPVVPVYWPGFWAYCNNYWYDYHVTNTVVVTNYVRDSYNANLVSYCVSGNIMYAIIDDADGETYLKVFDNGDNLLAAQRINRRYCQTEIDRDNGGCWIFKKNGKDPMLFLYAGGELLIYEAD